MSSNGRLGLLIVASCMLTSDALPSFRHAALAPPTTLSCLPDAPPGAVHLMHAGGSGLLTALLCPQSRLIPPTCPASTLGHASRACPARFATYAVPLLLAYVQVRIVQGDVQGPDGQSHRRYALCQIVAVETRAPGVYK